MEDKLNIGITHGDINGISYELIMKLNSENRLSELCTPVIYGSSKVAAYYRKTLNMENINFNSIQNHHEINAKRCNILNCINDEIKVEMGHPTRESEEAAMLAVKLAFDDLDSNKLDTVVMAPLSRESFHFERASSFLDYLSDRYRSEGIFPIFLGEHLKIGLATFSIPLAKVAEVLSGEAIYGKLKLYHETLRRDFTIIKPKIAVLSYNSLVGNMGRLGKEEEEIIKPAIENARESGIMALGPYDAATLFSSGDYKNFDAVFAMYYEQALLPFKMLEGIGGAVYIAGLPVVCTTTLHGAGFDMAGRGTADESGLRNALYMGMDIHRSRNIYDEASKNPLPHYEIGGNINESDMNVEQIAGLNEEVADTH